MVKVAQEEIDRQLEEQEAELVAFQQRQAKERRSLRVKKKKAELVLENVDMDRARSLERELKSIEEFDQLRAERDRVSAVDVATSEPGTDPSVGAVLGLMPSEFVADGFPEGSGLSQDLNGEWNFLQLHPVADSPVES